MFTSIVWSDWPVLLTSIERVHDRGSRDYVIAKVSSSSIGSSAESAMARVQDVRKGIRKGIRNSIRKAIPKSIKYAIPK